ncbi:WXG100 family type VII secretion target [Amycolatopsis umgeniensis]|uniref:WXG100 family type VII secretion target n=1 Tax=Amycolatopsis umgeniensis TaxID=336628 RepID=A0A841BCS4_9PSEU|nr:WXG100 family type VII secretion target [Amycolatopsis umgeniensis]MBB5856294.1 WXG100 family type VII secretion target [Amycolatopsis umgeniensis]
MSMPHFQKTDSGMKGGLTAIQTCEDECKRIHSGVTSVRADLKNDWQGAASQTFLNQLEGWETEYLQVLNLLTEIKEMVNASDQQMNTAEDEINMYAATSFGGESDRVLKELS